MKTKNTGAFLSALFILSLATQISTGSVSSRDSLDVPLFGRIYIYNKTTTAQNVIIMISGDGGWKLGIAGISQTFSEMNSLVIGIEILKYYQNLRQRTEDCYNVAADFVQLATFVEKKYDFPDYQPPVIMGISTGATLVYGVLAQGRPGTFIGGISVGFCPDVELGKMFCQINGLTETVSIPGKKFLLKPDDKLGNPWIVLQGQDDKTCSYSTVAEFVSQTRDAEIIALPKVGHAYSKSGEYMAQWKEAFNRLIKRYEKDKPPKVNIDDVKNLPVVITNSKIQDRQAPVALLISGDGGWYGFEQQIADHLAKEGIPTVGLDSKKYFWKRRTPEGTAADIAKALSFYGKEWGRDKFVLIGYSLGAEIVPFIVNGLPEEIKSKIESAVLLSPATTTDFEIHISNMLGMGNRQNTYHTIDEIVKMQNIRTLIIFGDGEKTEIPALLSGTSVQIRKIPGDHHYKFNLPLIMQTMKDNKAF